MFTDREIIAASERDQSDADTRHMAGDIATFYAELIGRGTPKDLAKQLTQAFAVTVVFMGCGCGPHA